MERDFLGLTLHKPLGKVKEEAAFEIGALKNHGAPWNYTSKASAVPQFLPFKGSQEEKAKRNLPEPFGLSTLMSPSSACIEDLSKMNSFAEVQKFGHHTMQDGSRVTMKPYCLHPRTPLFSKSFDNTLINRDHFSNPKLSMQTSSFATQGAGNPSTSATPAAVVANAEKTPASSQLTIFFGGTVHVYDGISSEKAQAIMLLAGDGKPSSSSIFAQPREQFAAPPLPSAFDLKRENASTCGAPCSVQWSRISASSQTGSHSAIGPTSSEERSTVVATPRTYATESSTAPIRNISAPATTMILSIPQARNASLARFLKKRKERVMNAAAPYILDSKSS